MLRKEIIRYINIMIGICILDVDVFDFIKLILLGIMSWIIWNIIIVSDISIFFFLKNGLFRFRK